MLRTASPNTQFLTALALNELLFRTSRGAMQWYATDGSMQQCTRRHSDNVSGITVVCLCARQWREHFTILQAVLKKHACLPGH